MLTWAEKGYFEHLFEKQAILSILFERKAILTHKSSKSFLWIMIGHSYLLPNPSY